MNSEQPLYQEQIQKHFRWNFAVSAAEGGLFFLGLSFGTPVTIMPLYVSHLTSNRVLIGLVAAISGAGWYLPQLFTANYVAGLPVKKRMVVNVGLFSERLPWLVMALSAFLLAARVLSTALFIFFVTLAWWTVGTGVIAVAWQEMLAKIIPVNYRGRLLGLANSIGTAAGVLGAGVAAGILARFPFPTNFGICFSVTFFFIMVSWAVLALTREPPLQSQSPAASLRDYARRLPGVLRRDRNFTSYLVNRIVAVFGKMGIGFVTVYAVQRWRLADSQAGLYTTMLLGGQAVTHIVGGAIADRMGHKVTLEASSCLTVVAMLLAVLAPGPAWMYLAFAALGAAAAIDMQSGVALPMEFAGPEERPTYLGLANTIPGLFALGAPILGGWIASWASYKSLFSVAAVASTVAWAVLHFAVREPRHS